MKSAKVIRRNAIRKRIRRSVKGNGQRPRMSVFRSNKQITVQVIDDLNGHTLAAATSAEKSIEGKTKIEKAASVGKIIAERTIAKGISEVVFDRGGYLYHGRVKSLADGARQGGLKF